MSDKWFISISATLAASAFVAAFGFVLIQRDINATAAAERLANKNSLVLVVRKDEEQDKDIKQLEMVYITIGEINKDISAILKNQETFRANDEKYNEWRLKKGHIIDEADRFIREQRRK